MNSSAHRQDKPSCADSASKERVKRNFPRLVGTHPAKYIFNSTATTPGTKNVGRCVYPENNQATIGLESPVVVGQFFRVSHNHQERQLAILDSLPDSPEQRRQSHPAMQRQQPAGRVPKVFGYLLQRFPASDEWDGWAW
jgi:hypothetical protein